MLINVNGIMSEFSTLATKEVLATAIDYDLFVVYPQFNFVILIFDSNATNAAYTFTCWECIYLIN
jgi:hypothetical protein